MDRFVITNMRVFRVHGILSQRIATMPIARILDISVHKPIIGRVSATGTSFSSRRRKTRVSARSSSSGRRTSRRDHQRVIERSGLARPPRPSQSTDNESPRTVDATWPTPSRQSTRPDRDRRATTRTAARSLRRRQPHATRPTPPRCPGGAGLSRRDSAGDAGSVVGTAGPISRAPLRRVSLTGPRLCAERGRVHWRVTQAAKGI